MRFPRTPQPEPPAGPPDRSGTRTRRLAGFLALLTAVQFGFPVTYYGDAWHAAYPFLYGGLFIFGVVVARGQRLFVAPVMVLTVVFFACAVWYATDLTNPTAILLMYLASGAFMVTVLAYLVRFIFTPGSAVDPATGPQLILAAISVYLLIGGVFAVTFGTLETVAPGSFTDTSFAGEPVQWQQMVYYSYVTLATLGYGEVLPISPWARSLAVLETVAGTIFLATVIARLVGAYASLTLTRPGRGTGD